MSERPPESVLWNLGGRERDEEQWRVLLDRAGFDTVRVEDGAIEGRCR